MSKEQPNNAVRFTNITFTVLAGQAGCFSLFVIVVALLVGIWLDAQFQVRGPFTIGLLLASIPISLFFMVRIALGSIKMISPPQQDIQKTTRPNHIEEEDF